MSARSQASKNASHGSAGKPFKHGSQCHEFQVKAGVTTRIPWFRAANQSSSMPTLRSMYGGENRHLPLWHLLRLWIPLGPGRRQSVLWPFAVPSLLADGKGTNRCRWSYDLAWNRCKKFWLRYILKPGAIHSKRERV